MSAGRLFPAVVIAFWLASMGWLFKTKVIPLLLVSAAPAQHTLPLTESSSPRIDHWDIVWNDRTIGTAKITATRNSSGGQIDSIVSFERLPIDQMLKELFGPVNQLLRMAIGDVRAAPLSLCLNNTMYINYDGSLESFYSRVQLDGVGSLFQLRGTVHEGVMDVDVIAVGDIWPEDFPRNLLHKQFDIPADAFVADAFSPQSQLSNLSVGQTWQFHTYRTISPNRPLQLVEARVESVENIAWEGNVETVFVVSLRNARKELSSTDDFLGRMWVRGDGLVVKQLLRAGNLEIVFLRRSIRNKEGSPYD